ncbi:unnamed protein product [Prorocentrum cordatum]|uniref:Uncharacterized protein n=1 Tax=Prorocentrum cordatum TaxID=2364126 RepID=A0ABN9WK54_9DINO|nr:unnamed protein product [Polarella glacialis]
MFCQLLHSSSFLLLRPYWNTRPSPCARQALASMSDEAGVYAVPAVQDPGFVYESNHESQRWDINQAARTTQTTTTAAAPDLDERGAGGERAAGEQRARVGPLQRAEPIRLGGPCADHGVLDGLFIQ